MIETKIIVKPKGNSGTGNSSGASGYGGEYVPEADYAARAGKAKKAESADLAMRANTANTADRAKYADKAGELDEEAEVLQRYIRKDIDDIVQRTVTWEKVQKLLGGLLVGEDFSFDADGNIIAHSIASENANEAEHKGFSIIQTGPKTGKYKLNINELLAFSKAKVGDKFVFDAANDFRFDAEGNIIAHTIASDGANEDEEKGFIIARKDDTGKYKLCVDELLAWGSATVKQLHVKGDSTFDGNLFSKQFISDFLTGKGWGIYNKPIFNAAGVQENKWTGEFDDVIVRGSLRVYEMIISQLLGENDNRIFTGMMEVDHYDADSGKVYLNTQDGKLYNPFRRNDIIMVQQFNGMPNSSNDYYVTKNYELLVTDAGCGSLEDGDKRLDWVKFANFTSSIAGATPEALIKKKDTFVRVDNLSDPDRKGIMQIITVGTASPHMDVVYGLKTDPEGALKGRLGNLEGIVHPWFGRLQGFGEYLNNLYAVGDLILRRTGESVDTKFQVLENMFSSRFAKTSYELTNGKNYLENGQFLEQVTDADNTIIANWEMNEGEDTELWVDANGLPFMVNGSLSTSGNRKVSLEQCDGRQMLRLQNCGLRQKNAIIKQPGTHKEYVKGSGEKNDAGLSQTEASTIDVQDKLYVNVRLYAKTAGQLTYGFEGCKAVEDKLNELAVKTENIAYSGEWQTVRMEGKWNGTGDFIIRYSGDCNIALVTITDEPLSEFSKTVSTQIVQTAENIKLLGENINKVNGKTTKLGFELDAEKGEIRQYVDTKDKKNREDTSSLITQTSSSITSSVDKKLKNQYDTITSEYSSSITQKADQITLKVSAAQTAADNAQSAADAAQGTADTAIKKNAELKVTVDGIGSKVDTKIANAKGEITKEYTSAINQSAKDITLKVSAAQTAADNAQSAADAAQGTADTAKKSVAELKVTMYGISTTVANKADTSTLNSKVSALNSSISTAKQSAIDAVNARIDGGVAEFYQQASPPSFTNLSWTKAECQRHAGALWYVVEPGAKGYVAGHLYRFVVMRGTGGAWEDVDESIDSATTVQQNASGWNVASGMFDAKGNLTASGVASITPTVTTIANTRIDEKKGEIRSGLVVASDFAKLESVVAGHSSKIETFITEDDAGTLISNAKISADNIVLKGHCMKFTGGTLTITTDNFTLDEKGNVSLKGRVNATSGSIGGFNIGEYTIGSVGKTEGMGLSNECLKFMNQAYLHGEGYFITCGSYMKTGLRIFSTTSPSNNLSTGILIHIDAGTSTPSDPISGGKMCTALDLLTRWADQAGSFDMTNPYEGNHAIVIRGGDVIGLRPSFVRLAANYQTLTEYHYTVECYNTSAITIYLPSSPKYGQCYTIIQRGSRVTFSSGKGIYDVRRASSATTWYSDTRGQVSWLWYNGSQWIVCYTTN
nr:alanine-zipper protein [Prevotella sp.]